MARGDVTFRTTGLRELAKALGELPKAVGRGVVRRVLIEAGEPTARAARDKVRVDTEELRDSIHVGTKLSRSQKRKLVTRSTVEAYIGPGPHVQSITEEFGTVREAGHPYLRPAWDETQGEVLDRTGVGLSAEIDRAARRRARQLARASAGR